MKKLILTICLCFLTSVCWAEDYWVYIRIEDRSGITAQDDEGRSKRGDVVDVRLADYELSDLEKKEWLIIKTELTKKQISELITPKIEKPYAYRKHKIDISKLEVADKVGVVETKIDKSKIDYTTKTVLEFSRYERSRKIYLVKRQFHKLREPLLYAWQFWVRPAMAAVACADDTTDGEQICTINKTGQDYDTQVLWEDAKDGDVVTAGQIRTGELYDDDGEVSIANQALDIDGSTCDSTHYLKLTAPVGERHDGKKYGTGARIAQDSNEYSPTVEIDDDYCVVEWIGIRHGLTRTGRDIVNLGNVGTALRNCIVYGSEAGIDRGVEIQTAGACYVINNIIYGSNVSVGMGTSTADGAAEMYNNTIYGSAYGIRLGDTTASFIVKNNIMFDNGSGCFTNIGNSTHDNNATTDNDGDDDLDDLTAADELVSVTGGSEDFHLQSDSTCVDAGTDLGTTPTGIELDIDNDDRDTLAVAWDVGADEYVAAATGRTRRFF